MPSGLYLIGSKADTLIPLNYIEPCLNERGIQVLERDIVPATINSQQTNSILTALVGKNIQDPLIREAIINAYQNAYKKCLESPSSDDEEKPYLYDSHGIVEEICDQSTDYKSRILPPKIKQLALYSGDKTASELFPRKVSSFHVAYDKLIIKQIEDARDLLVRLEESAKTLEEKLKQLATTPINRLR